MAEEEEGDAAGDEEGDDEDGEDEQRPLGGLGAKGEI